MPDPVVFRPRGGVVLAAVAMSVCAVALVWLAVTDGPVAVLQWGWPIIAFGWLAWLLYIRPTVTISEGFIEIRNPLRTHRVPWGDITDVESRYALTVRTVDGRILRAWAAPAPGARQALRTRREDVHRAPGDGDTRRPSDAEGTLSGDAATLVHRGLERHRRSGAPRLPGGTVTSWAVLPAGATVLLVGAAIASLFVLSVHA